MRRAARSDSASPARAMAGCHIFGELAVPRISVELEEPLSEAREVLRREAADCVFDLAESAHHVTRFSNALALCSIAADFRENVIERETLKKSLSILRVVAGSADELVEEAHRVGHPDLTG